MQDLCHFRLFGLQPLEVDEPRAAALLAQILAQVRVVDDAADIVFVATLSRSRSELSRGFGRAGGWKGGRT